MMTMVYTMISDSTETREIVVSEDRDRLSLEFAFYRLELDIDSIYSPLFHSGLKRIDSSLYEQENNSLDEFEQNTSFTPSEKFPVMTGRGHLVPSMDSLSKDSIVFLSSANKRKIQDTKQSNYAWIRYSLRDTEEKEDESDDDEIPRGEYELVRQVVAENIYTKEHSWDKVRAQVLLKSIKSLEFEFWSTELKKFVSSPRELNEKKNSLRLLRVNLVWISQDGNEIEFQRSFRVNWPYFDPQKDIDAIKSTKTGSNNNNSKESDEE